MATHYLGVVDELEAPLESGRKDIEVRAAIPVFSKIAVGDTIVFNSKTSRQVKHIHRFRNFTELLKAIPAYRIWPGRSEEKTLAAFRRIMGYAESARLEILAFELSK